MPGRLFIPVGIPGCGKSSWADAMGFPVVSTDQIREMFGDVNSQDRNGEVFKLFHETIATGLAGGFRVIADATNLRDFARAKLRDIASQAGAETHLVVFQNPDEAILRNRRRDRVVPEDVMIRMLEQYEIALRDIAQEEYTTVTKIRSFR